MSQEAVDSGKGDGVLAPLAKSEKMGHRQNLEAE
jgi:hypothetical protein